MHLSTATITIGRTKRSQTMWCSSMQCRNHAISVFLNLSTCSIVSMRYSVVFTSLISSETQGISKNLNMKWGSLSFSIELGILYGKIQCSRRTVSTTDGVTLRSGIARISFLYLPILPISKRSFCLASVNGRRMSMITNSKGLHGEISCIHHWCFWEGLYVQTRAFRHIGPSS